MGALRARRHFAAITGSKFRIKSYPLLACSQHVGATASSVLMRVVVYCELSFFARLSHYGMSQSVFIQLVCVKTFFLVLKTTPIFNQFSVYR